MTVGFGERALVGTWIDERKAKRVLNILILGWHYQFIFQVSLNRWKRR